MASTDPDNKAADVITYVGVPLAVLGLVPILYNSLATLITLYKIKRKLRINSVAVTTTRGDIVNRFSARRSKLDGGSWTIFEWERQEVGMRILRVQYPTQLRKPQVEVDFGELVSYLHSLGAIPDEQGWKRLRSSGLWMPKGLSLMNSPDGSQKALVIASLDDSDGNLSLAATADWSPDWVPESSSFQPPNVVRLPSPTTRGPVTTAREAIEAYECPQKTASSDASKDLRERKVDLPEKALNSPREKSDTDADGAVVCHLHSYGLSDAHMQTSGSLTSTVIHNILDIEHLRVRAGNPDGIWFASAATAYKTASKTILWSYTIPDDILSFASKATVPCGVLVLLGLANSSETPEWATKRNAHDEEGEAFFHKMAEERLAAQAGTDMSPEQGRVTASDRKRAEQQRRLQDLYEQVRLEDQSRAVRTHEAFQSPRWDASRVAEYSLRWLKNHDHLGGTVSLDDTAGAILHRMVLDRKLSSSVCAALDLWKAWVGNEVMRGSDLAALQEAPEVFAQASLLVALIKDAASGGQQTLVDLQACVRTWKTVRFG